MRAERKHTLLQLGARAMIAQLDAERNELMKLVNPPRARMPRPRTPKPRPIKTKSHWTQRPENKPRVAAMLAKALKARRAKGSK